MIGVLVTVVVVMLALVMTLSVDQTRGEYIAMFVSCVLVFLASIVATYLLFGFRLFTRMRRVVRRGRKSELQQKLEDQLLRTYMVLTATFLFAGAVLLIILSGVLRWPAMLLIGMLATALTLTPCEYVLLRMIFSPDLTSDSFALPQVKLLQIGAVQEGNFGSVTVGDWSGKRVSYLWLLVSLRVCMFWCSVCSRTSSPSLSS